MRVCVEGNIGCGKSTALAALDLPPGPGVATTVCREPLETWGDLLRRFYDSPSEWALPFSLRVLLSYRRVPHEGRVVVTERGPPSCRHVFGQMLFNEGKMTSEEWQTFKAYYEVLAWMPDAVVFVDVPADVCYERIRRRDRPEERGIDIHYVRKLEFQYETMLRYMEVPVVRVDGTQDPERVAADLADAVVCLTAAAPESS